jgi:hypothetical protein
VFALFDPICICSRLPIAHADILKSACLSVLRGYTQLHPAVYLAFCLLVAPFLLVPCITRLAELTLIISPRFPVIVILDCWLVLINLLWRAKFRQLPLRVIDET